MVLLYYIVEILRLPQLNIKTGVNIDTFDSSCVGTAFVDGDLLRQAVQIDGALKVASCCRQVTFGSEKKVHRIAHLVDCAVQIFPLAGYTKRAYQGDLRAFMAFTGINQPEEFRSVTRGHILAWRADLEKQGLAGATIRRKLAALASLYDYLCESNAVTHKPVKGVKRPRADTNEGKTPALGDAQARQLLAAPPADTLKGKRDRAILSVLLYHALCREELTKLLVKDFSQERRGVPHLRVQGKGGKLRFLPAHPAAETRHCGQRPDARRGVRRGGNALHGPGGHQRRQHGTARVTCYGGDQRAGAPG